MKKVTQEVTGIVDSYSFGGISGVSRSGGGKMKTLKKALNLGSI